MKKLLLFSLILILTSCEGFENNKAYLPQSVGGQGRIDVIMDESLWEGRLGEIVEEKVAPYIKYYPTGERLFDLYHSTKVTFNNSPKKFRNILELEINTHPKVKSGIKYESDIWASDQARVKIIGKNQQELYDIFTPNSQEIQDYFMELELNRMKIELLRNKNERSEGELLKKHHLALSVPKDMELTVNKDGFAALSKISLVSQDGSSAGDLQQFIMIYHYPYTSEEQLTKKNLIAKRDSICKKYFKGKVKNSYMRTLPESIVPSFEKERLFKGIYAFEIRGLYGMVNDYRGGPFINISLVDKKRNRIITVEGHVFAPKFPQRPYMMELETMMNTLYFD